MTMRRLARSIGITPMAIYHHFATREALLRDVVDAEFGLFVDLLDRMPTHEAAADQIKHALDAYLDYALSRPEIFDYVFSKPREGARRFPEDFRARHSPTLNPLADAVTKWMEEEIIETDDIWEVTLELWAHVHGYIALYRAGRFSLPPEAFKALVHRSIGRLFHGLMARHAAPTAQPSTKSRR